MPDFSPSLIWSGVALAVAGTVIAALHKMPAAIWSALVRLVTVSVEIHDQDLVRWVGVTAIKKWGLVSRHASAFLRSRRERTEIETEPARGKHVLKLRGRWVLIDRGKDDSPSPGAAAVHSGDIRAMLGLETIRLTAFGRSSVFLSNMLTEAHEFGQQLFRERSPVRICDSYGNWIDLEVGLPRPLQSVILPGHQVEDLRDAIREFLSRPGWYAARGLPWRFGVGIFGPPGTGKSSLVRSVSAELGLPLHVVDLSSRSMNDGYLLQAFAKLGPRSAVVFDDLDASLMPMRESTPGGVTLAGLLGAIDGPAAAEGRVLFLCSNWLERIDSALLRDGRIDMTLNLGPATQEQAARLYRAWHPGDEEGARLFALETEDGLSMAELQGRLRRRANGHGEAP